MKFLKLLLLAVVSSVAMSLPVAAQLNENICTGVNADSSFCQENEQTKNATPQDNRIYGPNGIVTRIVRIIARVIGVAAVIMIIVGGIRYITSSGDTNNINGAKNTILYAIIGLVIAALAEAIIIFVINQL